MDKEGNLGFLASTVDVPRFGARARKVFPRPFRNHSWE
jgi:hypothetical protein